MVHLNEDWSKKFGQNRDSAFSMHIPSTKFRKVYCTERFILTHPCYKRFEEATVMK